MIRKTRTNGKFLTKVGLRKHRTKPMKNDEYFVSLISNSQINID